MKFLRITRRRLFVLLLAIPLVPATLWTAVLCLVPTEWARERLVRELEAATGRKVAIGSIHLGPLGNLRIQDVQVAEHATADDPWLKVGEARLDLHLFRMIMGCCKATDIALDRLDLRIHRRADGSLEFADLLACNPKSDPQTTETPASPRAPIALTLQGARVVVIDDPSETRVELEEASGSASWTGTLATIPSIKGRLNGGSFEFAAKYDRGQSTPDFEAELRARGVSLSVGMKSIGLLVPVVSETARSLDGQVDLELALRGRGDSLDAVKSSLKGHGAIRLNPIDLSRSKLLDSLDALRQIPAAGRVGSVESDFAIENSRVTTDDLTLKVSSLPIILAGWTDFDGRLDYRVKSEAIHDRIASKLPAEARAILGDLKQELGDLADIRITGTVNDPKVIVGKGASGGRRPDRAETEARLREAAKRLGGKYLR